MKIKGSERTAILTDNVPFPINAVQRIRVDTVDRDITQDIVVYIIDVLKLGYTHITALESAETLLNF